MKSLKVLAGIILVGLLIVGRAQAQTTNLKIAYINLAKVFDSYNKTKEYDAALEKRHDGYKKEFDGKIQKVKDSEAKLSLLQEDEKAKLQAQIDKDKSDLAVFEREKTMDLRKERDEKIRELLGEIEAVIKDYSEKEGFALVLNDRVLAYSTKDLDITDPITKILNEKYPAKK